HGRLFGVLYAGMVDAGKGELSFGYAVKTNLKYVAARRQSLDLIASRIVGHRAFPGHPTLAGVRRYVRYGHLRRRLSLRVPYFSTDAAIGLSPIVNGHASPIKHRYRALRLIGNDPFRERDPNFVSPRGQSGGFIFSLRVRYHFNRRIRSRDR